MAACSLLVDTSDLSGGADVVPDGSSDVLASSDAAPSDANPSMPFCATVVGDFDFCDDFDGKPLDQKWDRITGQPGTASTDHDAFLSSPGSLAIRIDSSTFPRNLSIRKALTTGAGHFGCAFALRVDDIGTSLQRIVQMKMTDSKAPERIGYVELDVGTSTSKIHVSTFQEAGTSDLYEDIGGSFAAFPPGQWRQVEIFVDNNGDGASTFHVDLDGLRRYDGMFPAFAASVDATLLFGIFTESTPHAAVVNFHVDDVLCRINE